MANENDVKPIPEMAPERVKKKMPVATNRKGPKTDFGKMKSTLNNPRIAATAKVFQKFRKCNKCPLGEHETSYTVNGKKKTIIRPAKCRYWKQGQTKCPIDGEDWKARMQAHYRFGEEGYDTIQMMEDLAQVQSGYATAAEQVEMALQGRPGYYAQKFAEGATKAAQALHEMKYGTKNTNMNMNMHAKLEAEEALTLLLKSRNQKEGEKGEQKPEG